MNKILIAYFSASGQTAKLAKTLAKVNGGDLFEIEPEQKYTDADLNWMDKQSRSSVEMQDRNSRPKIKNNADADVDNYDMIFIGFPIWWYREPSIIDTFVESNDFEDKKIVLFATSGSSNMGEAPSNIQELAPKAKVLGGRRFDVDASEAELAEWMQNL